MRALLLALLFTATTSGCASDKEPSKHSPDPAPAAAAGRQADDTATDVEQARNAAKTEAATVQATADVKSAAAHEETSARLQKEFDAADRRFNELKERATKATGAKRKQADVAIADATTQQTKVMAGIAKLRDASGSAWNATKMKIDADAVALASALHSLETTLQ